MSCILHIIHVLSIDESMGPPKPEHGRLAFIQSGVLKSRENAPKPLSFSYFQGAFFERIHKVLSPSWHMAIHGIKSFFEREGSSLFLQSTRIEKGASKPLPIAFYS